MSIATVALTSLSHGGGCGCKIAPAVLDDILAGVPRSFADRALLVGLEKRDDAAVYRLNDSQAIVATTDFFMPIVDDPIDFGRIAATNALSDIYAMGGRPLFALAVVGMPLDKLPVDVIRRVLEGGAQVCAGAGAAVAGGHSIDAPEPIYGLAVIGRGLGHQPIAATDIRLAEIGAREVEGAARRPSGRRRGRPRREAAGLVPGAGIRRRGDHRRARLAPSPHVDLAVLSAQAAHPHRDSARQVKQPIAPTDRTRKDRAGHHHTGPGQRETPVHGEPEVAGGRRRFESGGSILEVTVQGRDPVAGHGADGEDRRLGEPGSGDQGADLAAHPPGPIRRHGIDLG